MSYDLGTARGKIELEYEGREQADRAEQDMERLERKAKDANDGLERLGRGFKKMASGLASVGKVGALAVSLGGAAVQAGELTNQILGMVPALTSLLSLSSALPATFLGGAAAIGVLKAALAGVGDTLKAAFDPEGAEKFNEALKRLSPSAQEFAKEVKANVGALRDYQQSIQEAFFNSANLDNAVKRLVFILGRLRPTVLGLADDFSNMTREFVEFATSERSIAFLENSVKGFRAALSEASTATTPLLTGIRAVGEVGLPLLTRLGEAAGNVGTRFGEWLSQIASDGRLQEWINTALATLRTLGELAGNIGSILNSIFSSASQTSGGLLESLVAVTGEFARFLDSAEGSAALGGFLTAVGEAARALAPVITTLAGALAGALGPALSRIATALGPVLLQTVNALAPAFGPLANAIADLVIAIAPLIPPLATIVSMLAQGLSGAVSGMTKALGPLISVLGTTLVQAFQALQPVMEPLIRELLPRAAELGLNLARSLQPLMPVLVQLAQTLATAILDNMPQIIQIFDTLVPAVMEFHASIGEALLPALKQLVPLIPPLVAAFITLFRIFNQIVAIIIRVATAIVRFHTGVQQLPGVIMGAVTGALNFLRNGFNSLVSFIGNIIGNVVGFFAALPGRIGSALAALPGQVWALLSNMMHRAAFLIGAGIGTIVTFLVTFPGKAMAAIKALPGLLANFVTSLWNRARALFVNGVNSVVSFARNFPGAVGRAISALGSILNNLVRAAWTAVRNAFTSGINNAISLARSLPGRIRSAIGNLAGLLGGIARDAINGFVNGIRNGIGAVGSAARSLGSSLLSGIRSTLKIGSPSREMIAIGRFVNQGLEKGLLGTANQVRSASNKLANMVLDAFNSGLISKRQRNSVLTVLSNGTKNMLALINRANTVSAKLKTAQANLANVQKSYNEAYASAVQKTKETFSLVTAGQRFVDLDRTKENFQQAVDQAKQFAANIQILTKRGLNKDLLQQLVNAGAAEGGAMAAALATANSATLAEFNRLQGQLNASAASVGKATADAMYGAGLKAAQGLVKGLQNQQRALEQAMNRLADLMINRIKKSLKIKSPSRIMFDLGRFTAEGFKEGLDSLAAEVAQSAIRLAQAPVVPTVRGGSWEDMARRVALPVVTGSTPPPSAPQAGVGERRYILQIGDKVLAEVVLDAITGAPVTVKKAGDEGSRRSAWAGSGR
jgi:phage-related protein